MKTFQKYKLLNEKISQKEISSALSDDNIIIGMEFEFYLKNQYFTEFQQGNEQIFEKLPFSDYKIGYGPKVFNINSSFWRIEQDRSLEKPNGLEIISPKMSIKKGMYIMKEMFDYIEKYGMTTDRCGFHVNLSYDGRNLTDIDQLKLALFAEEGFVWKFFKSRKNNIHTQSLLDEIIYSSIQERPELSRQLGLAISQLKVDIDVPTERNYGINLTQIAAANSEDRRIEFRYLGGKKYHRKYDKIKTGIGKFASYLKIAFDPYEREREYIQKLIRLRNQIITTKREMYSIGYNPFE